MHSILKEAGCHCKERFLGLAPGDNQHSVYVVDEFYPDPDRVRSEALRSHYFRPNSRFPLFVSTEMSEFRAMAWDRLSVHSGGSMHDHNPDGRYTNVGRFTVALAQAAHLIYIHTDPYMWSAVVFLSPNPAPDSGTCFYKRKLTMARRRLYETSRLDLKSPLPLDLHPAANDKLFISWKVVSNEFNRAIIFDARYYHAAQSFFGDSMKSGRMIQTFFWNSGESYRDTLK